MNTFTLNGNTVTAREFDFNLMVQLDDYGVSIQDAGAKPMAFIRAYVALCLNRSLDEAGQVINDHIVNGGNFDDLLQVINKELENSGFFRALQSEQQAVQKKAPAGTRKAK